jgi:ketosteroid isomerase-like protein
MKKLVTILGFIFLNLSLIAQQTDLLVKAEIAFEKACLEKGLRSGFLANMDSNAIAFTAKGPVAAKPLWTAFPNFEGIFSWSASYTEMSTGGDWGYTTGNYEHRARSRQDTVAESGQYTTVWQKTENGEWKYLIDIGNPHPQSPLKKFAAPVEIEKAASREPIDHFLPDQEGRFIDAYEKNIRSAYQLFGSRKYLLNLSGYQTVTSTDSAVLLIEKKESPFNYSPDGVMISSGMDMAAVYGTFDLKGVKGNYLRIWRHEKTGWKIALEVLKM